MVPLSLGWGLLSSRLHTAGVAQSAEHLHGKEVVRGSIPRSGSSALTRQFSPGRGMETRSLGTALDITDLLIESRTKRRHAVSVGLKDDQEAVLGFGIEDEIAAAITEIGMELPLQLIAVCVFDFWYRIPHPYPRICFDRGLVPDVDPYQHTPAEHQEKVVRAADQPPVSTLRGKVRRDIYRHPGRTLDVVDVHSDRHRSKTVDTKLVRLGHRSSDSHRRSRGRERIAATA